MSGTVVVESTLAAGDEELTVAAPAEIEESSFVLDYDREVAYLVLEGTLDPGMVPRAVKGGIPV